MRKLKTVPLTKYVKEYRHNLSDLLVTSLQKLYKFGGTGNMTEFLDGFSERGNFQKLKYWGLIEKLPNKHWRITSRGVNFLKGNISLHNHVITLDGKVVEFEGKKVTVNKVDYPNVDEIEFYSKVGR